MNMNVIELVLSNGFSTDREMLGSPTVSHPRGEGGAGEIRLNFHTLGASTHVGCRGASRPCRPTTRTPCEADVCVPKTISAPIGRGSPTATPPRTFAHPRASSHPTRPPARTSGWGGPWTRVMRDVVEPVADPRPSGCLRATHEADLEIAGR